MTPTTFQSQMKRLQLQYGAQIYGQERTKVLWEALASMSDAWFESTVSRFIGSTLKPPLLPEFQSAKSEYAHASNRPGPRSVDCSLCNDGGWLLEPFNREDTAPPVAMRCDCRGGPKELADRIRKHPERPDKRLAAQIEATFEGVSAYTFKTQGMRKAGA